MLTLDQHKIIHPDLTQLLKVDTHPLQHMNQDLALVPLQQIIQLLT